MDLRVGEIPPIAAVTGDHRVGSFWRRLSDRERVDFARAATVRRYDQGAVVIRAADPGQWAAVLHNGRVQVLAADGPRPRALRWAGDIVGEQTLLDHQARSATVRAETPVLALLLGRQGFDQITTQHPNILRVLGAVVSERLREADQNLADTQNDTFTRVADGLLRLAEQWDVATQPGTPMGIGSQAAFGESLGLSRESVVRALKSLREDNVITTDRGIVTIEDFTALRKIADR